MTLEHASPHWHVLPSKGELADTLARDVGGRLARGVKDRDAASLAVSGGTTPGLFFDQLSREQLDWTKVVVTLVDERLVSPDSERSNERLVRERLLTNEARLARFVPLYGAADEAEQAARSAEAGVALLAKPFDVVVLGMGTDGHTASFFPDAPNLDDLTNADNRRLVQSVNAPSGGEPRLTLTLPVIAGARLLALHIEGPEKRAVLERALAGEDLPIRRVLDAASRVAIYWTAGS